MRYWLGVHRLSFVSIEQNGYSIASHLMLVFPPHNAIKFNMKFTPVKFNNFMGVASFVGEKLQLKLAFSLRFKIAVQEGAAY